MGASSVVVLCVLVLSVYSFFHQKPDFLTVGESNKIG